jgi:hypothetical protein
METKVAVRGPGRGARRERGMPAAGGVITSDMDLLAGEAGHHGPC